MLKVEGHTDLVKDPNTGAIVSVNMKRYLEVKEARRKEKEKDEKIASLEERLAKMEELLEKLTDG